MSHLLKNLIFVLGLAIILWVGYTVFIQKDEDLAFEAVGGLGKGSLLVEAQDLLIQLNQLKSVKINKQFFENEDFVSLRDLRQPIFDEPKGRINPFARVE